MTGSPGNPGPDGKIGPSVSLYAVQLILVLIIYVKK